MIIPGRVRDLAADARAPAYVYDLTGLRAHIAAIRSALGTRTQLYYAVKANPDARVLATLAPYLDGLEVSSAGELAHATTAVSGMPLAFGGPGKTSAELAAAVTAGALIHVESVRELRDLGAAGTRTDVLLRVNPPPAAEATHGCDLVMGGTPAPFGMDFTDLRRCGELLRSGQLGQLRVRGLHAHVASGLGTDAAIAHARSFAGFAGRWCAEHQIRDPVINVGGGMTVSYGDPERLFGWARYGRATGGLRIEPGRSVTAYCGWYITRVLDVKTSYGTHFTVVAGGTHHLRTPAARGHSQPCAIIGHPAPGRTTITGQLCTPKDVLARDIPGQPQTGDLIVFGMAGAYAWNISHHDFLMHPAPEFHYV